MPLKGQKTLQDFDDEGTPTESLWSLLNKGKDNGKNSRQLARPLIKDFPIVAEILGGLAAKGDQPEVAGGTITFFIHEGKIRFSANVKSAEQTLIGEVADILNPWGSINSACLVGDVSSKRYTERNAMAQAEANGVKVY